MLLLFRGSLYYSILKVEILLISALITTSPQLSCHFPFSLLFLFSFSFPFFNGLLLFFQVRIWDPRVPTNIANNDGSSAAFSVGCLSSTETLGGWVSDVSWCPGHPTLLAASSHDGALRLLDVRCVCGSVQERTKAGQSSCVWFVLLLVRMCAHAYLFCFRFTLNFWKGCQLFE